MSGILDNLKTLDYSRVRQDMRRNRLTRVRERNLE